VGFCRASMGLDIEMMERLSHGIDDLMSSPHFE
jgi:hypothetical protein